MILVDTSVWVHHLRFGDARLAEVLEADEVVMHPFVIGELACGHLRNRAELLELFSRLPAALVATDAEALAFIEKRRLAGQGIGYVDVHLLASVVISGVIRLWTRDQRLRRVSVELGIEY